MPRDRLPCSWRASLSLPAAVLDSVRERGLGTWVRTFEVSLPNTWPLGHILTDPGKSGNLATGHLVPSGILWDTVSRFVVLQRKVPPCRCVIYSLHDLAE